MALRTSHFTLHFDVELNLRFCTRRTDRNLSTVFSEELECVASFRHIDVSYVTFTVSSLQASVVLNQSNLRTTDFLWRVSLEVLHHFLDFVSTALTRLSYVYSYFLREAVFYVDFHQYIIQCLALILSPCADFSQQSTCRNSIFIANEVFSQEAVAFFTTTDVLLLAFAQTDFTSDPLEASVAVTHFDVVLVSNSLDEFCSYDSLHAEVSILHLTCSDAVLDDVVQEDQSSLVTVDEYPFALIILTSHTYAVSIRVSSHYDISVDLLRQFDSHRQCFSIFWVRRNNCWEVTAFYHLFFYAVYVFKAPLLQSTWNELHTCTVDRSKYDAQVLLTLDYFRVDRNTENLIQVYAVDVFTDDLNQFRITFELDVSSRSNLVYFSDDTLIVWSQYLCTIIPVSLVTVVFLRVVRSSQDDTALATEVTDSE